MRKIIVIVLVAVFVATGAIQASAETASSSQQVNDYLDQLQILRDLREGMTGEDVKALQKILASQSDIYPEGIVSGYYGPLTAKAVKKYQEKFGLDSVGLVGPKTKKKLNEIIEFTKKDNASSTCVRIPPGHFVAPGWLKKHGGVIPPLPECQKLPKGIFNKWDKATSSTSTTTVKIDTKAPRISSIRVASTTASTSKITWKTSEKTTGSLIYSTSSSSLASSTLSVLSNSLAEKHSVELTSLATSTKYYFMVKVTDKAGNITTSSQRDFTTLD